VNCKILSIVTTAISALALAGLVIHQGLFSSAPIVIALQVMAGLLMIWARLTFGIRSFHASANPTAGGLVTRGPYKYIRHPIYAAVVVFAVVGVLANWSLLNGLLGLVVAAGMVTRAVCEERLLRVQYPEYADYTRRTWRMIPYVF
jgi:protein-S-isoprenylcysteine O-methyltransferase Ste14